MKALSLGSMNSAGAGTAVTLQKTPFIGSGFVNFFSVNGDFNGTVVLQGSDDGGSNWATIALFNGAVGKTYPIDKFPAMVRPNVTAYTSGTIEMVIVGD